MLTPQCSTYSSSIDNACLSVPRYVHGSVCVVCVCVWEGVGEAYYHHIHHPYISSEHAALFGLSSLCPLSRSLGRETGSTPG